MSESIFITSPFESAVTWFESQNIKFWEAKETTSTNTIAKAEAFDDPEVKFYVTNHQTQGRGRNTNTWTDNQGLQLLLTASIPVRKIPPIWTTLCIGEILTSSLKDVWGPNFLLKAPNDIYLYGKKVCGILSEIATQTEKDETNYRLIVGIGINVLGHPKDYPSTSLNVLSQDHKVRTTDWNRFLKVLTLRLETLRASLFDEAALTLLEPKLVGCGLHHLDFGSFTGFAGSHGLKFQEKVISWTEL